MCLSAPLVASDDITNLMICLTLTGFLFVSYRFFSSCQQSDHTRFRHTGGLRGSQHLPDSPERDAQLPGQELEWENKWKRATDQQQLREVAAAENS